MKYSFVLAFPLLAVIIIGWYCSENFSGRVSRSAEMIGYTIIRPGHVVDSVLSGNFHGGFGDWRDTVIKITVSFVVWLVPCVAIRWWLERDSGARKR
jgi:hypothetical protein